MVKYSWVILSLSDKLARPRQGEGYILYIAIKKVYGDILSCKGEQSLMGSIYLADRAPQRTILIECTPMVCIHCFTLSTANCTQGGPHRCSVLLQLF